MVRKETYDREKDLQSIRSQQLDNENKELNNKLKKRMFYFVLVFLTGYTIFSGVIVLLEGFGKINTSYKVIMLLVSTNLVEILVLPKLICEHLFPADKSHQNSYNNKKLSIFNK